VKTACLIAATLACAGLLWAQPDPDALPSSAPAPAAAAAGEPPRVTHIDSDSAEFDLNQRTAIYRDHVHVTDSQMSLTCDWLKADLPQAGHIDQIIARTNVVIDFLQDGQMTHVTADNAVYTYKVENSVTNEIVTLTGNPHVVNPHQNVTADTIVWNRLNNNFHFDNIHGTFENVRELSETNAPAETHRPETKRPPAGTNAPVIDTNQPVG